MKLPIKRMLAIGLAVAVIAGLSFMPADGHARGHVGGSGHGYHGGGGCSHNYALRHRQAESGEHGAVKAE